MFRSHRQAVESAEDEPSAAVLREADAVMALRRFVRRHNWQALTLAVFSLAAAALLWGAAYLFLYWLCLISVTVKRSYNVETIAEINDPRLIADWFPWWFLGGALLLLVVTKIAGRRFRMDTLRDTKQYLLWLVAELLVAIPNVTFSVWGNLAALVRLSPTDAVQAWRLLEWMHREGDRLSAAGLCLLVEDERQLAHIVFVLQIVGLVDLREKSDGWFLCLQNRDAYQLISRGGEADD